MTDLAAPQGTGARLARVAALVGVVPKDKTNTHDGYSYQSEAAIKDAVHRACMEVALVPDSVEYEVISDEWVPSRQGAKRNLMKLRCILRVDGKGPFHGLGAGIDYGDKALMKAETSSLREAWKTALTIPSIGSPDPEADESDVNDPAPVQAAPPAPPPAPQEAAPPAPRPAPRRQAPAPHPAEARREPEPRRREERGGEPRLPNMNWLGENAGLPISEASLSILKRYIQWRIERPALPKWQAREQQLLDAVAAEINLRESGAVEGDYEDAPEPTEDY